MRSLFWDTPTSPPSLESLWVISQSACQSCLSREQDTYNINDDNYNLYTHKA